MEERATHITLSDANFREEVLECQQLVLVLFRCDWSGLSDIMESRIANSALAYADRIKTCKLDLEANERLAEEYHVRTPATLLFFRNGELVDHLAGPAFEEVITTKLDTLLG